MKTYLCQSCGRYHAIVPPDVVALIALIGAPIGIVVAVTDAIGDGANEGDARADLMLQLAALAPPPEPQTVQEKHAVC